MLRRPWLPAFLLFSATLAWFAARCAQGFHFVSFGDECLHLVGARAIRAGDVLYRDFVEQHGPLTFIVAHGYGSLFGWKEPLDARRAIAGLVALVAGCVMSNAVLRTTAGRLWAGGLFLGLLAGPWLLQSLNMVNYYVIGGALAAVPLAWFTFPALFGAPILRWRAFASGCCLAWLCADSYPFAPTAVLLGLGTALLLFGGPEGRQERRVISAAAMGFVIGGALTLAWMLRFADLIGYVAYHFIESQFYFTPYVGFGWHAAIDGLKPSFSEIGLVHSCMVVLFEASLVILASMPPAQAARRPAIRWLGLAMIAFAIFMLNFRGAFGFNDAAFLVASVACFALSVAIGMERVGCGALPGRAWLATVCVAVLLGALEFADRYAVLSPFGLKYEAYAHLPRYSLKVDTSQPVVHRIREILKPGERLMVLEFDPDFYLKAGILPVRKFDIYLPWDADYGRAPWFGMKRDLCEELAIRPPPVIYYEKWKVWDKYPAESFMPCLQGVLDKSYVADKVPQLFIRRDRFVSG